MKHKIAQLSQISTNNWNECDLQTDDGFYSVMLKKIDNDWVAYLNQCPHQGKPMSYLPGEFLETDDKLLVCPAHGATFKPENGECITGPCKGQSLTKLTVNIDNESLFVSF